MPIIILQLTQQNMSTLISEMDLCTAGLHGQVTVIVTVSLLQLTLYYVGHNRTFMQHQRPYGDIASYSQLKTETKQLCSYLRN